LLGSPPLRPRLHLVSAPHSAADVLGERSGEAILLGDLVGTLLGHAEEFGDLDESERMILEMRQFTAQVAARQAGRANG
jgi:hypothetical protein